MHHSFIVVCSGHIASNEVNGFAKTIMDTILDEKAMDFDECWVRTVLFIHLLWIR